MEVDGKPSEWSVNVCEQERWCWLDFCIEKRAACAPPNEGERARVEKKGTLVPSNPARTPQEGYSDKPKRQDSHSHTVRK